MEVNTYLLGLQYFTARQCKEPNIPFNIKIYLIILFIKKKVQMHFIIKHWLSIKFIDS